ncbi:MAG: GIY-YIG nuclease family protein [Bacteroidetes bacterium]|nr:MAG: GIY-YIG nuclease family protein [Bacteroidota bacterium]
MPDTKVFYVYILYSLKSGMYYKGCTQDLSQRVKRHNAGKVKSTKGHRPWKLIYFEKFETRTEARKRENFFKSPPGHFWLKEQNIICERDIDGEMAKR